MQKHRTRVVCSAMLVVALAALGLAGSAQAKLTGAYERFANCPYTNAEVKKCLYSVTESGEVVLGSKKVPIEKAVTLQGGAGAFNETEKFAKFYASTNGITLSKTAAERPRRAARHRARRILSGPGQSADQILLGKQPDRRSTSTLELAGSASDIRISEAALALEEGIALRLPVKVHLENPFLGKNCYVGLLGLADHLEPGHRRNRSTGPQHTDHRRRRRR